MIHRSKIELKILEDELHKESGCCLYVSGFESSPRTNIDHIDASNHSFGQKNIYNCNLYSITGYKMSYFLEAYCPAQENKDKIIKVIKKALTGYSLTMELSNLIDLPIPLARITREYFELYSDVSTLRFGNAIDTIIILKNDNLALAFDNGVVCIYDWVTKTIVKKSRNYVATSLCGLWATTLVCGYENLNELLVWDFKNNTEKTIDLPHGQCCKKNSIMMLEENILLCISTYGDVYVINFNHDRPKINKVDSYVVNALKIDKHLIMGYSFGKNDMEPVFTGRRVSVYNVDDYININMYGESITFCLEWKINQFEYMSKNKFFCLTSILDGHCRAPFSRIYIIDIKTNTEIVLIDEYERDSIESIVYLGDRHLALHRHNRIEIIDIKTKKLVQQIDTDRIMTFMTQASGRLVVVDSIDYSVPRKANNKSCVRFYQNLGG